MKRTIWLAVALALLVSGCAKKRKKAAPPPAPKVGVEETGIASWYGRPYHGRPSASGEIYDMEKLTAAHRTLPFGSIVRVHSLDNDREVEVRINDRGPFVEGRIIDLSHAAARDIAMIGPGIAKVRLRIITLPEAASSSYFAVQVGAFRDRANAGRLRARMEKEYGSARLLMRESDPPLWRVQVGREISEEGAEALAQRLRTETDAAFVVRVEPPAAH
jgi:rare lipoprotein A